MECSSLHSMLFSISNPVSAWPTFYIYFTPGQNLPVDFPMVVNYHEKRNYV